MSIEALYKLYLAHPSVQTDTRKLKPGDIFFALKGPNFDGNSFSAQALAMGAALVVADETTVQDERIIRVDDSLTTLQQLASFHRDQFKIPVIAITGSNGKTTTKELLHAVLSSQYKTYTTEGNLNNHIGVPLTLLKIRKDAEMAVIEMGANHQQEIASYCQYAKPDFGLITNIGKAHLEGFGGEEGVKKGKGELFDYLRVHGGTAFVNADDAKIVQLAAHLDKKVLYGGKGAEITGNILSSDPFLKVSVHTNKPWSIATQLVGSYNFYNVMAAVTVGKFFHISDESICKAIEEYSPSNSRSQLIKQGSNTIILDAYNANPGSMKAAIENFAAMKGADKILLLGDMKELGVESAFEHRQVINLIEQFEWKEVALVGPIFSSVKHPYHAFDNAEAAGKWFRNAGFSDAFILVKGSRSMQMEKVVAE